MAYAYPGEGALDYYPCRYGKSKLLFRGPGRDLDKDYVAVLGGTETYGKFVPVPYPALVERDTGLRLVNLGCVNAGLDAYVQEPAVLDIVGRAAVTVVQIVGAQNASNRFYSVHPRRNDRFLWASPLLRQTFPEVDFTEFHFTRHLLRTLHAVSAERFAAVAEELRAVWLARMTLLLDHIPGKTVLLWIGDHAPPAAANDLDRDPMLIDAAMIGAVRAYASDYLEVVPSPDARASGLTGMAYTPLEQPAALGVPGPAVHAEVADKLAVVLQRML
ncbi:DUF6473 family protein [Rhodobacter ferrooxidans]|uniref:DUF6473 domain-containing protein n=1 Tax=Rhodobacter ferrooxidans TaxID=371731 RepID=C8S2K4_9RHOB|nr:DUF6473 family protein [Rhodobacter sp. SW2]EEW24875.1 conserved hypothetical protein [Rhodobacter sp. SW2]